MDVATAGAPTETSSRQMDPLQRGLLTVFRSLLRTTGSGPGRPTPLVLDAADVVVVVSGTGRDGHATRNAVLDIATHAGVVVLDDLPGCTPTGRVSLVLATHHTAAPAAQHVAVRCGAPVLLPDGRCVTPGPLHLWVRPEPTLTLTGPNGRQDVVLHDLHLRNVADSENRHPAAVDLFAHPSGSGLLLGMTDGAEGATVALCPGPRSVWVPAPTTATVDGVTRTVAPGTYRIDLAHPPLYRLHAESAATTRDRMTR
jgi:hypothetical protein